MEAVSSKFSYKIESARVVFGPGALASLPDELRMGTNRFVLIGTPGRATDLDSLRDMLGTSVVGIFHQAQVHVPATVLREAVDLVHRQRADCAIALGGGSAIGLAKAVARETRIPVVAIPTTYSGSEMTSIWGITDGETKQTGRDPGVAPVLVIYDPLLTLSLPPKTSATSGINAVAHCVEALYAPDGSPMSTMLAVEGLALLATALPSVVAWPDDVAARSDALFAAHFAGYALNLTTMGLHHRLCHVLGGLGLPHALTHAILLPHVTAYNAPAAPAAMSEVAGALQAPDASAGLSDLNARLGITETLRDAGLQEKDIERAVELVAQERFPNPREVTREAVREILEAAW